MQTFLPYPDFAASARALDDSRLGKQRVETLQILRALVIPDYGWQRHPAVRMWMGHVPALALYGLAMVDEWAARGRSDSTHDQILEFTSDEGCGAVGQDSGVTGNAPMPPWLGEPAFHAAHRSNLIRKSPDFYRDRFPDVPDDLPYVWPGPAEVLLPNEPAEPRMWVWRGGVEPVPDSPSDGESGWLLMPRHRSSKRPSPKWQRQVNSFIDVVHSGDQVAVADAAGGRFRLGHLGPLETGLVGQDGSGSTWKRVPDGGGQGGEADDGGQGGEADDGGPLLRPLEFTGWLERSDVVRPALLQDPRTLFAIPLE